MRLLCRRRRGRALGFLGTHLAIKSNHMEYVDQTPGFTKVHGLREDMMLQLLYQEEQLSDTEYEESNYDNEEYIWDYENAYYYFRFL